MKNNKGSVTRDIINHVPEQDKYGVYLSDVMDEKLFEVGSVLNDLLVKKFNVSETYARQILKRAVASKAIKSTKPYTFGKGGQHIYLANNQALDAVRIMEKCQFNRPPIYRLLKYMTSRAGIISFYDALKITAAPIEESSTKVSSLKDIVNVLTRLNILIERNYNGVVFLVLKEIYEFDTEAETQQLLSVHFHNMILDCSLLPDIIRWLNRSNIISGLGSAYRNKNKPSFGPKHNNLIWDAIAYTKTTGINEVLGSKAADITKQTLVALDVVLSESYDDIHLDGFYSRIQIHLNAVKKGKRKVVPIVIYRECSEHVKNKLSMLGFLSFEIGSIFGSHIYSVLSKLSKLDELLNYNGNVEETVSAILKTIRTSGQEDALKDVKGTLFEFLMYPVISKLFSGAKIERNRFVKFEVDGKSFTYEYDYVVHSQNPDEIVVIELKGYNDKAIIKAGDSKTKSTLRWFFRRTFPILQKELKNEFGAKSHPIKAVYITTASYDVLGKNLLAQLNAGLKPIDMQVGYDRTELIALLRKYNFTNEIKAIERFYTATTHDTEHEL